MENCVSKKDIGRGMRWPWHGEKRGRKLEFGCKKAIVGKEKKEET